MKIQLQKVQYTYDNTTAKSTILQKVQYTYDNTTANSTIYVC